MYFKPLLSLTVGALLAASAAQVFAQAAAKPARLVNRDELRTCMNSEADLGKRRKELEARKLANREEVVAIKAESEKMKEDQEKLDPADDRKVRAFKRVIEAHNTRVKAANAAAEAFNTDLDNMNKQAIAYNEQCAGITFRSEDKEAILKEREAAAKQ